MGYLINIDTAINIAHDLKSQQKNLVFTHGAYDLFHAGHSLFLNKSKKEGDILIVGVEPDSNVKKYKSYLRPIINQKHRGEIVCNHKAVDFVFMVDELDDVISQYYIDLYKCIKPKIITLGKKSHAKTDFRLKKNSVNYFQGDIKEIDTEVTSTTKIISSIVNRYSYR